MRGFRAATIVPHIGENAAHSFVNACEVSLEPGCQLVRADGLSLRARLTSRRIIEYVATALGMARNSEPSNKGQPTRTKPGHVMSS